MSNILKYLKRNFELLAMIWGSLVTCTLIGCLLFVYLIERSPTKNILDETTKVNSTMNQFNVRNNKTNIDQTLKTEPTLERDSQIFKLNKSEPYIEQTIFNQTDQNSTNIIVNNISRSTLNVDIKQRIKFRKDDFHNKSEPYFKNTVSNKTVNSDQNSMDNTVNNISESIQNVHAEMSITFPEDDEKYLETIFGQHDTNMMEPMQKRIPTNDNANEAVPSAGSELLATRYLIYLPEPKSAKVEKSTDNECPDGFKWFVNKCREIHRKVS